MFASLNQTVLRTAIGTLGTAVFATLCLAGAAAPAHAGTIDAAPSRTITVSDLDLSRPRDRAVLDARIRRAARAVCVSGETSLRAHAAEARCFDAAVGSVSPATFAALNTGVAG